MSRPKFAVPPAYGAFAAIRNAAFPLILLTAPALADPATVVALGDSLTQGYGLPQEKGFVPVLQDWLAENGATVEFVNAGVSGDTTAGGLSRIEWSLTPEVDALIVALGGNDLLRGIDPAVSRDNLSGILDVAAARDLPVLLIGIDAPSNYGAEYEAAFEAMYSDLSQEYDTLLLPNFLSGISDTADRSTALATYMQPDGIHPNAEGVELIVETMGPTVLDLVKRAEGG